MKVIQTLVALSLSFVFVSTVDARPEYPHFESPLSLSEFAPLGESVDLLALELGEEYTKHSKPVRAREKEVEEESSRSFLISSLLYLPNRFMDLLDIFRFDVGVGPSFGVVARVTKWGQVGYRNVSPASLRVGLRGRRLPLFLERTSELGVGPLFLGSKERKTTPFELGAGADIFLVGAYVGISFDEIYDFFAGIIGFDPSDDGF